MESEGAPIGMQSTAQFEQIEDVVRSCVLSSLTLVDEGQLEPERDEDLLRSGLIDSLGVMEIVGFLEQNFNIVVDDQDIVPQNFGSIRDMSGYVAGKKGIPVPGAGEFQRLVAESLSSGSTVLVVSRGDDTLLSIDGHDCWHFPRTASGEYAGSHPADSEDAVTQLETLRAKGATHIAFPADELWWLDYYEGLRLRLESAGDAPSRDGAGVVFALGTS